MELCTNTERRCLKDKLHMKWRNVVLWEDEMIIHIIGKRSISTQFCNLYERELDCFRPYTGRLQTLKCEWVNSFDIYGNIPNYAIFPPEEKLTNWMNQITMFKCLQKKLKKDVKSDYQQPKKILIIPDLSRFGQIIVRIRRPTELVILVILEAMELIKLIKLRK